MHARQHHGTHADVRPRADAHRPDRQVRLNDRDVGGNSGVHRTEHPGAGSPAYIFLDDQVARVEIALRADPRAVAYHTTPVETPLQDRLIANKHTGADVEGFRVAPENAAANVHPVAEASRHRPADGAAHHSVEVALAVRESSIQFEQRPRFIPGPHGVGQLPFERRIRLDRPSAVNGLHGAVLDVSHVRSWKTEVAEETVSQEKRSNEDERREAVRWVGVRSTPTAAMYESANTSR